MFFQPVTRQCEPIWNNSALPPRNNLARPKVLYSQLSGNNGDTLVKTMEISMCTYQNEVFRIKDDTTRPLVSSAVSIRLHRPHVRLVYAKMYIMLILYLHCKKHKFSLV